MSSFTPLHDRLLVKPLKEEEKVGSFFLPENAREKPNKGIVIAIGGGTYDKDKREWIPLAVAPGQTILYGKYAGNEIKIDGEDFLILKEEEVFGIMAPKLKTVKTGA